jgi:hypothetical protein
MKKVLFVVLILLLSTFQVYAKDKAVLKVDTDGNGEIKVVGGDEDLVFGTTYPKFSIVENTKVGEKYKIGAKASEQWKFMNWNLNGNFYSTEQIITVEITGDMNFVAVFEFDNPDEETEDPKQIKQAKKMRDSMYLYVGIGILVLLFAMVGIVLSRRL